MERTSRRKRSTPEALTVEPLSHPFVPHLVQVVDQIGIAGLAGPADQGGQLLAEGLVEEFFDGLTGEVLALLLDRLGGALAQVLGPAA